MAIVKKPRPREQRSDAARNHEALVRAATAAVHREGPHVVMATIAADAGVGIGTLYRHFRTREDLLNFLAHRSFEQVLANVQAADSDGTTASGALRPGLLERDAADIIHALASPEVYHLLVTVRGWSPDRYERWLAGTLISQLLPARGGQREDQGDRQ